MLSFKSFIEGDYYNWAGQNFWGNFGAGVLPIAKDTGRVLLNHRSSAVNEPNTWGVWGGKVDDAESGAMNFSAVAQREFCEEAGYCGAIQIIPGYVFQTHGFEYHNFFGIIPREFEPRIPAEHRWETQGWKWVSVDEIGSAGSLHFGLVGLLEHGKTQRVFEKIRGILARREARREDRRQGGRPGRDDLAEQ